MSGRQAVLAVLALAISVLVGSGFAQDEKNEVTGIAGRIFISQTTHSGRDVCQSIHRIWRRPFVRG